MTQGKVCLIRVSQVKGSVQSMSSRSFSPNTATDLSAAAHIGKRDPRDDATRAH
jgi:hypothetical protein